jgi:4-amino-4-deoxy-L-arabinose transferase-like glycosyltransferase
MSDVLAPGVRAARVPLVSMLAIGLALRIVVLGWTAGLGAQIVDEQHYLVLATSVADGKGFATAIGPTSLRPPLYPAFIAAVWTATGTRSLQAVRVAQFGLGLALALVIYGLAHHLFGARAALWAASIAWFYPSLLLSNYLLLTEVLFSLLVAGAVWACVRLFATASPWDAAAAGALFGLAALTRSVVYPFPVLLAVMVVFWLRAPGSKRLGLAAVVIAAWGAVVAPWAVRNTTLQGVPVLVDTMGGMNLRMGNYEYTPLDRMWDAVSMAGDKSWIIGLPAPPAGSHWTEGQKERWARSKAVAFMLEHPGLTLQRSLVKFGDFWALDRDFIAGVQRGLYHPPRVVVAVLSGAITLSYPLVLFPALFGLAMLTRGNWPTAWMPIILVLFVCALHSIVFGHPRYRLPLMPLLGVYAAPVLAAAPWRAPVARMPARWPAAAAGAFVLMWIAQFAWRDWSYAERLIAGWRA